MREESHLDDMRSAIRGDFERLAERRGGQDLMSVSEEELCEPEPQEVAEPELVLRAAEPERGPVPERSEPESGRAGAEVEPDPGHARRERSWLERLLGR